MSRPETLTLNKLPILVSIQVNHLCVRDQVKQNDRHSRINAAWMNRTKTIR